MARSTLDPRELGQFEMDSPPRGNLIPGQKTCPITELTTTLDGPMSHVDQPGEGNEVVSIDDRPRFIHVKSDQTVVRRNSSEPRSRLEMPI